MASRYKTLILTSLILFTFYYIYDLPAALNKHLDLENNPFGAKKITLLYSAYALPNIILPILLGSYLKTSSASLSVLLCVLVFVGQLLFSLGVYLSSFAVMLSGRLVYGIGGECFSVIQNLLIAESFEGRELAFSMSCTSSIARIGIVFNYLLTPLIAKYFGKNCSCFLGTILCMFGCFLGIRLVRNEERESKKRLQDKAKLLANASFYESCANYNDSFELSPEAGENNSLNSENIEKEFKVINNQNNVEDNQIQDHSVTFDEYKMHDENILKGQMLDFNSVMSEFEENNVKKTKNNKEFLFEQKPQGFDFSKKKLHNEEVPYLLQENNFDVLDSFYKKKQENHIYTGFPLTIDRPILAESSKLSEIESIDPWACDIGPETIIEKPFVLNTAKKQKKNIFYPDNLSMKYGFILIILLSFLFSVVWTAYSNVAALLLQKRYGISSIFSGRLMAVQETISIIFTIIIGYLADVMGNKLYFIAFGSILKMFGHFLIYSISTRPLIPMIIIGLSGPFLGCYWPCITYLVRKDSIARGFALITCIQNFALTFTPLCVSFLISKDESYDSLVIFILLTCFVSFTVIMLLYKVNKVENLMLNRKSIYLSEK